MKKQKINQKKTKKLSTKIAFITSFMLIIIFTLLIAITMTTTKKTIQVSSFGELQMMSSKNAADIQQIMDRAEAASTDLTSYMQNMTKDREMMQSRLVDRTVIDPTYRSQIYPGLTFQTAGMKMEDYLISTIQSVVLNSEDIISSGILFEPNVMENQRSYALYADKDGSVTAFGEYAKYSEEAYYKDALSQKKEVYTDPYVLNDMNVVTVAVPVLVEDKVIAVMTVNVDIRRFDKIKSVNEQYPSMYTAILKDNGIIIYESSGLDYVGTNTFEYMDNQSYIDETKKGMATGKAFYTTSINSTNDKVYKFYDPISAGSSFWYSMTAVNAADVNRMANQTAMLLLLMSVVALVVILLVILSVLKKMLSPISEVVNVANHVADGDLSVSIQAVSDDEIGLLATAFQQTITALKGMIEGVAHILDEIADDNLTVSVDMEFKGDFSRIEV
ncbi:MAG: cache domain-containing protein, partial [Hungatella sp.]